MRVCVLYCGGCNPQYDRKKILKQLGDEFPMVSIGYYEEDKSEQCDVVLVLAACKSACVDFRHIPKAILVKELADYKKIAKVIEAQIN